MDLPTLAITAAASAGAAYACSQIWAPGTLASAAFTPVLVAVLKEALARPANAVSRAVPVRGVVRSTGDGGQPEGPAADQQREVPRGSPRFGRRAWTTAIVTGLLGFLVAAVIITVPEVVAGKSASGGGRQTTLFGGEERDATDTTTEPDATVTAPPASTVTVPPAETTTVPPDTTTVPPAETTPEPVPPEDPEAPLEEPPVETTPEPSVP